MRPSRIDNEVCRIPVMPPSLVNIPGLKAGLECAIVVTHYCEENMPAQPFSTP